MKKVSNSLPIWLSLIVNFFVITGLLQFFLMQSSLGYEIKIEAIKSDGEPYIFILLYGILKTILNFRKRLYGWTITRNIVFNKEINKWSRIFVRFSDVLNGFAFWVVMYMFSKNDIASHTILNIVVGTFIFCFISVKTGSGLAEFAYTSSEKPSETYPDFDQFYTDFE